MVHTHFVWSHGGNQVFLCGDFTAWIKYHQMVCVEGSATTFMTICDLPPGVHKFKFLVDGVWRIDEMQPVVEDEYGVNNVVVVQQPELLPQMFPPVNDGLSVMPIDGFNHRNHANVASTSGSDPNEEVEITGDDIGTTTRRLFKHLLSYKAYDLIPESGKVFALDDSMTVEEAFLVMHEEGLAVTPLWNAANLQISGMLTASDFIMFLIELHRNRAMATNNVNLFATISAWKEGKLQLQRRPLIQIHPDDSLNNVAVRILENHISSIPVLYVPEGSTCPMLLHVICLSGLLEQHISSVPIVDDNRTLINVFCRSDVLSLAKNNAYAHVQLDQTTISQALQLVDTNTRSWYGICTRLDSLYTVIGLLSDPGIRRVVVVEAGTRYVLGLITLRDVCSLIFRDFS
ncbi:sucrose nonfermenting 4-like protein isoform X2 [Bidens hawaiensis]|uniref:sucrose nonfermenting 4-like protein isoform X2 n=1 Tax=Bidens hawaiensis TaxID=980011 RepID=UPI00404AAB6E